ncbi:hypothetical protein MMC18_001681 [Xylographa bjoerkii]|nr:hypothetical protein [Xylographa bjoerkii]
MSLENLIEGCTQRLPWNLIKGRGEKRHQQFVDPTTGEIVPEPSAEEYQLYELDWKGATENGRSEGGYLTMAQELSPLLEKEEESIVKDEPYLSLDYLTTAPLPQRRGVGGLLIRSGLAVAEAAGVRIIVTSTPAGLKLYEKHGFERVSTVVQDDSKYGGTGSYIMYFLVWNPAARLLP